MKILSRLMAHFGYVRLKDYGYELTPGGKIVQVVEVEDDRFAPPPWQPVAFQSAASLLPPRQPPAPRPLPPPPEPEAAEDDPQPLFKVPGAPATVETAPPGKPAAVEADEEDPISIEEVPEEEEWEWKMALARARENAEKDKKERDKAKQQRIAARRGEGTSFKTSSLPLAAPPVRPAAKVVDTPKPMAKIPRPEPRALAAQPARKLPDKPALKAADRPAPAPDKGRSPITRLEPRAVTAQPPAHRDPAPRSPGEASRVVPRTAPPKAPPGNKSRPLAAVAAAARPEPAKPAAVDSKPAARASLEKSVSRVFSPPAAGKPRPLPRLARGTEGPVAPGSAQPTRPQLAQGSSRLPAVRDPSNDVTATDITAVDRAQASMREDEDTRVNVAVVPPSADITLDIGIESDPEVESTMVDGKPNGVAIVAVEGASPLPRLTARLRRPSVPN